MSVFVGIGVAVAVGVGVAVAAGSGVAVGASVGSGVGVGVSVGSGAGVPRAATVVSVGEGVAARATSAGWESEHARPRADSRARTPTSQWLLMCTSAAADRRRRTLGPP